MKNMLRDNVFSAKKILDRRTIMVNFLDLCYFSLIVEL